MADVALGLATFGLFFPVGVILFAVFRSSREDSY